MSKTQRICVAEMAVAAAPPSLRKDRYAAGFTHALRGGQLDKAEYLKLSFREGFRAAKLHMRDMRRKQGIIDFPLQGRIKLRAL
ncbi:MAG: hypothetical protein P8079_00420 [Gammaproteobacteria bacterium]|jgi:hypothetical protein